MHRTRYPAFRNASVHLSSWHTHIKPKVLPRSRFWAIRQDRKFLRLACVDDVEPKANLHANQEQRKNKRLQQFCTMINAGGRAFVLVTVLRMSKACHYSLLGEGEWWHAAALISVDGKACQSLGPLSVLRFSSFTPRGHLQHVQIARTPRIFCGSGCSSYTSAQGNPKQHVFQIHLLQCPAANQFLLACKIFPHASFGESSHTITAPCHGDSSPASEILQPQCKLHGHNNCHLQHLLGT